MVTKCMQRMSIFCPLLLFSRLFLPKNLFDKYLSSLLANMNFFSRSLYRISIDKRKDTEITLTQINNFQVGILLIFLQINRGEYNRSFSTKYWGERAIIGGINVCTILPESIRNGMSVTQTLQNISHGDFFWNF